MNDLREQIEAVIIKYINIIIISKDEYRTYE
jgi:hypothetical protein